MLRIVCGIVLRIMCGIELRIVCGIAMVWFGIAWYGLVEILKLHVCSGRLSLVSGRLSGWIDLISGGYVGQMGGLVR